MKNLEKNKLIVRDYLEEVWNKKNSAVLERFIAPDYSKGTIWSIPCER